MRLARIFRTMAAVAMTAMSMGLTTPGAPVVLAAPVAPTASSDNYLSQLSFDQGTLVPAFISTTQEYVLTDVPYTYSVMMTYTTNSTAVFFKSVDGCYAYVDGDPLTCDLTRYNSLTAKIKIFAEDRSERLYTVTITRPVGVPVAPLVVPVTKLSHGGAAHHKCAVLRTGEVLCWGANEYGQLGLGTTSKEEFVPLTVTGVTDAVDVAVGKFHTCILRAGGTVQCMGRNHLGQLGDGTATDRSTPVDVLNSAGTSPLTGVTRISLGELSTCAAANASALCWGRDAGLNDAYVDEITRTLPLTAAGVSSVVDVAVESFTVCVLTNAGKVQCWGANNSGQMGIGSSTDAAISVPVTMKDPTGAADLTGVTALRAGENYMCVILTSQYQLCSGNNSDYQIADATLDNAELPVTTTVIGTAEALANVVQSAPSSYHGCTLTAGGTVHCSGSGYDGVLGIGLDYPEGEAPRAVTVTTSLGGPPLSGVVEVASGYDSTCARTSTAVYCWGKGKLGRLGSGVFDNMLSPHLSIVIPQTSSDASLAALTLDAPAVLQGTWVSSTTRYTVNVPAGETGVMFALTPSVTSTLNINGDSSAGGCDVSYSQGEEGGNGGCTIDPSGTTWITLTVTAEDGTTTEEYVIEITVAASLTTIDRVWPGTGLPEGGMPVQIFGMGFVAALTVTVGPYTDGLMIDVPFVSVNDGQIDFVMPAGVAGQRVSVTVQTANDTQTASNAFTYVQPEMIEFDGETGGVFTTTDGVVVTIPPQGIAGTFFLTMTPLPPAPGVPGNVLMYSFRLDAVLNGFKLETLTNPVTITLPIDEGIFAIADGERPWLYQWVGGSDSNRYRDSGRLATKTNTMTIHSAAAGSWSLVRGQEYNPGTRLMTVALRPMGVYALSTAYVREYWFPVVPVVK